MATFQETIEETPGIADAPGNVANYVNTLAEALEANESLTGANTLNEPKRNPVLGDKASVLDNGFTLSFEWSNLNHAFEIGGEATTHVAVNKSFIEEVTWGDEGDALKPLDEDCGEWVPDEVNSDLFGIELAYEIDSAGVTAAGLSGLDPGEFLSQLEIEDVFLEVFYEEQFSFGTVEDFGDSFISVERDGPVTIAVGTQGQIFRETNSETNAWEDISPGTNTFAEDILSVEYNSRAGEYLLSGKNGFVATSTDNGDTWTRKSPSVTGQHITKLLPDNSQLVLTGSNRLGLVGPDLDNLKNAHTFISPYGIIVPCYDDFLADPPDTQAWDGTFFYEREGNLTGIGGSKELTCSFWFDPKASFTRRILMSINEADPFSNFTLSFLYEDSAERLNFAAWDNSGNQIFGILKNVGSGLSYYWFSIDLTDTGKRHFFSFDENQVLDETAFIWNPYSNITIPFDTDDEWRIGASHNFFSGDGQQPLGGGALLAEFWLDTQFLDPNIERIKFYDDGSAVDLGSDGSAPTGNAPLIYLKTPAFNTNQGTGGGFTVVNL